MTTATESVPGYVQGDADAGAARQARLATAAAGLRRRAVTDLDRWLLIGGGVLLPLGAVLIFLGWYGASHTGRLFEQIPYMISGGLLGLGLVFIGGFLYFGYWLTRLVQEQRQQTEAITAALARLESGLNGDGAATGAAAGSAGRGLVATATGSMIHRPDCTVVAGKKGLRRVSAHEKGMTPCKICEPLSSS